MAAEPPEKNLVFSDPATAAAEMKLLAAGRPAFNGIDEYLEFLDNFCQFSGTPAKPFHQIKETVIKL
mgnify:CR=1 FL=1